MWVSWCKNKSFGQRFTCTYLLYLLTYYYWKLKRKFDFVSWPAQHFLLVIKKLYFFIFSPSYFVCSSEPTSVWWWKLPSSTKLQFSFSIFCLHWWKKSNLQIDVPKLWMPVSMKNQSFLGKLGMVETTGKIFKKNRFIFWWCCNLCCNMVVYVLHRGVRWILLWFDDFSNISYLVTEWFFSGKKSLNCIPNHF